MSLTIVVLVIASTVVLFVQLRQSAEETLLARGLDRASALAMAARTVAPDDGVLQRLSSQLLDTTVLHSVVFDPRGQPLTAADPAPATVEEAATIVQAVLQSNHWQVQKKEAWLALDEYRLWYPLNAGPAAVQLQPGPPTGGPRVLLLSLDTTAAQAMVRKAQLHAFMITALLALLLALTVRQVRLDARQRQQRQQQEQQRRFLELGRLSAVLAHEVRNPLGAIKGFAQITAVRFDADDDARADMDVIVSECERLERLVESLLRYARPLSLQRQATDVSELLDQVVKLALPAAASPQHTVHVAVASAPVLADLDRAQMTQALINIVGNALQAIGPQGEIWVSAWTEGSTLWLGVEDDGPGIAPAIRHEIFEPYVTSKATGTGIGLAITLRIVQAHAGEIIVFERTPHGTRMVVSLPNAVLRGQLPQALAATVKPEVST